MNVWTFLESTAEKVLPFVTGPLATVAAAVLPVFAPKAAVPANNLLTEVESLIASMVHFAAGVQTTGGDWASQASGFVHELYPFLPASLKTEFPETQIDAYLQAGAVILQAIQTVHPTAAPTAQAAAAAAALVTVNRSIALVPPAPPVAVAPTSGTVSVGGGAVADVVQVLPTVMPQAGSVPLQHVSDGPGPAGPPPIDPTSMADQGHGTI